MRTSIYNKVFRLFALLFVSGAMTAEVKAQENLHLFYKDGEHEKIKLTRDTKVEFVKQPYLDEISYDDTIHISASADRTWGVGHVYSNVPWTATVDADWLTTRVNKRADYQFPMGEGAIQEPFLIFAEANTTDQERIATVTLKTTRGNASKDIVVMQHPYLLSLTPIGEYHGFEATTNAEALIELTDTAYSIAVYPNHGIKILSHPEWMVLDTMVHGADGFSLDKVAAMPDSIPASFADIMSNTYVSFLFKQNRNQEERTGDIVLEGHGQKATVHIIQKGLNDESILENVEEMQQWMVRYGIVSTNHDDFSHMSVLHAADMMAEDMTMFYTSNWFNYDYQLDNNAATYYRNLVNWETYYGLITRANALIDLMGDVKDYVTNDNFVLGNAYAYRAMAYLYLIQLFQNPTTADGIDESLPGVPLLFSVTEQEIISAEWEEEIVEYFKGRNTVGYVMSQIEADITRAIELLQGEVRPSKNYIDVTVAQGIAARYYLLAQEWEQAAVMANAARNGYRLMEGNAETNGIRDGFMDITNEEWMWGFDHTIETQTTYASFFSHISNLSPGYSGLEGFTGRGVDARLLEQMSATDYRRAYWYRDADGNTESTAASSQAYMWQYPYAILKFGWKEDWTQDYIYMRAAEMVLIEAEALARQQKNAEAAAVLAELMAQRDPSWSQSDVTVEDVYLQRRLELIGEGHAYFDLKRLNRGIERNYEGSNHLEGYKLNVEADNEVWVYKIPQRAIDDDRTYNLSAEDNLFVQDLEAIYIYGDAVGVKSITDLSEKYTMADGINELTCMPREGMYEKYIVLEAGKEFRLVCNNEGVITPLGANLEAYDVSELPDNPTSATVKRGDLVVGEEAPAMMVEKTGLYHIVLDLNLDYALACPQIVVADVQWGVRGAMNGWGFTVFEEVKVDANSMTWTLENVEMPVDGEFKFAYGNGWKIQLDATTVKACTSLGLYSQPNGANIKVDKAGLYTITLTYTLNSGSVADSYTFTTMCTQEFSLPTDLYMIGQDFGNWDWVSDGVVTMTPVHGHEGAFWTTRYFTAEAGFKFCLNREWGADFYSLENNYGYTMDGGNCYVDEDGFYTIYVDFANSIIAVEPAAIYGIGDCFGGWDIDVEENKFVAEGTTLVSPVTVADGDIRMYTAVPSVIEEYIDWWQMEFNVYDGVIVYRGADGDQERVSVPEGSQVTLDLNAGTGSIAEPGVEEAMSTLKLLLSVQDNWDGDFVIPLSAEGADNTEDTGNAEEGAGAVRYIVRMWPVDDAAAWTEQVYYSTSPDGYIEVDTTLAEGTWAVSVWADRLSSVDSPYYSFEGTSVRANTDTYVGGTDAKDGFCYYEEVELYESEDVEMEMVLYRPLAKCEYIAMDMEDFLLSESERLGLESPSDVVLEDYTVRVSYEGFLPIEYNRATLRNTDSALGVSYECGITMLDDGTALLASDYILCAPQSQTLVSFHIAVMYEDGTTVYQKDLQNVPISSSYCTRIEGALVEYEQASR